MDARHSFGRDAVEPTLIGSRVLSPKRERFVKEYLVDLNATQAAIRAGYSENSAKQQDSALLTLHDVQARVQELQAERSVRTRIDQDWVITELVDTYREARNVKHLPAANQSLQLIGRHLGMFTDRVEVDLTAQILRISAELQLDPVELEAETRRLMGRSR